MANPVMWFEIIGPDSAALQKFYRDALGWKLTPPVKEMGNYSMVEGHEPGIGGGIGGSDGDTSRVSVYFETPDPQRVLDKALASGARLLMPVTTITPTTTIAMFTDPAGNTVGLMKGNTPSASRASNGATRRRTATRKKTTAKRKTAKKTSARKTTARKRTKRR
jgi:predicted enzyme related to lactoylglutathione lyase